MNKRRQAHVIKSAVQLGALASAARQEIVDVLSRLGEVPVSELAETLGRPADALYYHLRHLVRSGLVVQAEPRRTKGRQEVRFRTVAPELQLQYPESNAKEARHVSGIVSSMMRLGIRDFGKALRSSGVQLSGPGRELWALRATGWMNSKEVQDVNEKIQDLRDAVWKPKGAGRLYGITILLTPLDHRGRKSQRAPNKKKRRTR